MSHFRVQRGRNSIAGVLKDSLLPPYLGGSLRIISVAIFLLLAGCAAALPRRYCYSWGCINRASANTLALHCSPVAGKWDNGKVRPKWAPVAGCYDKGSGDIWVEDSCEGAKALPHEWAHKDGIFDPKKEGYDWD